jgi:capsular exopolysaccharide synthesis family protein
VKIREQLDAMLHGYETSLENSYKEADARVAELKSQLSQAKVDQILSARDRMRPFEEATQKLDDDQRLLSTLRVTLTQRDIDYQVPKRTIEILNLAEPAHRPSKPNWTLNFFFSLVFGSILGVGVAVLMEYFDMSFRNVADVETRLKLPVLGVIPFNRDMARDLGDDAAEVEPFRVLHTNLNLALTPGKAASFVIFSAGPGEGKSTTLHHLARVMAAAGERVLLIDSDVRRPSQHRLAGRPRDPGLSDLLLGKKALDEVLQPAIAPNLDFLPSGSTPGFTLSLLYVNRLRDLITELRARYQRIIFDSPPIIGVSDASVLASVADGAVLLIQHRRNPASMVVRAQQIIESLKTPLLGVVLNQVPSGSGDDYGYYTTNYSYYGGGEDRKRRKPAKGGPAPNEADDRLVLKE